MVFQAWTQNDELTVTKDAEATSNAVAELFSQKWSAALHMRTARGASCWTSLDTGYMLG